MRWSDLIRESRRAVGDGPGGPQLLLAAVGLAVALVVVTLGLSQTASAQVSSNFDVRRSREVAMSLPTDSGLDITAGLASDIEKRVRRVRGVTAAGLLERHEPVTAVNRGLPALTSVYVTGISPGLLDAIGAEARWVPGHDHRLARHEVLVGANVADDLGLGPLELDPVLVLGDTSYAVVGVINDGGRAPDLARPSRWIVDTRAS